MKINFYEEFPNKNNLKKLKEIKFRTELVIASKSTEEFNVWKKEINNINKNIKIIYWPIIRNSYWISPFSNRKDLIKLFDELNKIDEKILIDLELPLNRKLILKNIFSFFKNKKTIHKFLKENKKRIITAQYPLSNISFIQKLLGLDYNLGNKKSLMWYSSMNTIGLNTKIRENLRKIKNKKNYSISLGTITKGILGNEAILNPKNLEKDLKFVKLLGFKEVIIFRLGGLNKKYLETIKKFL